MDNEKVFVYTIAGIAGLSAGAFMHYVKPEQRFAKYRQDRRRIHRYLTEQAKKNHF